MRRALVLGSFLLATGCVTKAPPAPAPAARAQERNDADGTLELAIHDLVNAHRRSLGLPSLTLDARINRLARLHSTAMATGKVKVGHDGFPDRAKMLAQGRPQGVAENVAYDVGHDDPAREIVQGWLRSRNHRENIEGPYERTGVGTARNAVGEIYVTQLFVGPSRRTREDGGSLARGLPRDATPGRCSCARKGAGLWHGRCCSLSGR